jgi:hypothetical protein
LEQGKQRSKNLRTYARDFTARNPMTTTIKARRKLRDDYGLTDELGPLEEFIEWQGMLIPTIQLRMGLLPGQVVVEPESCPHPICDWCEAAAGVLEIHDGVRWHFLCEDCRRERESEATDAH